MAQILIIGFGNPMRGDDGIGWEIARGLQQDFARDDVQVVAVHQLTPEMAELASRAERVLFIDASQNGMPGAITCEQVQASSEAATFTHGLTPAAVVALSQKLYGKSPAATLLTVAGAWFDPGERMSNEVTSAIPRLIDAVHRFIAGE